MSELDAYGFRSDKAKTEMPSVIEMASLKANMVVCSVERQEVVVPANTNYGLQLYNSAKTFPLPTVALQSARNANTMAYVNGNLVTCVYRSQVLEGGTTRRVGVTITNGNSFPVRCFFVIQWLMRPNGSNFPEGDAWDINIAPEQ